MVFSNRSNFPYLLYSFMAVFQIRCFSLFNYEISVSSTAAVMSRPAFGKLSRKHVCDGVNKDNTTSLVLPAVH